MSEIENELKMFYNTVKTTKATKCYYNDRLDTYGRGCEYNCCYCYAKSQLEFRNRKDGSFKMWDSNNPATADLSRIKRKIKTLKENSVVRMGGMTDCFQPKKELKHKISLETVKALNKQKVHQLIVTKSDILERDDYLEALSTKYSHIQVTISHTSDYVLKNLENAPKFQKRINTIETLFKNGYDVSLRLSPIIIENFDFKTINKIKVNKVLIEFLRYQPKMEAKLKDLIDVNKYTIKANGYRHLPLKDKLKIINKLKFKEVSICDSVKEHYDYFHKNINYNPKDCCNLKL